MLVSAVRRGSNIAEKIVVSNLPEGEAYQQANLPYFIGA
jgi:hypothetical protein